jgi:uncharacterized FlaG/YvyC family protein
MTIETTSRIAVSLLQTWPVRAVQEDRGGDTAAGKSSGDDTSAKKEEPSTAVTQIRRPLLAGHLRIELDRDAGRFVQTLTDPLTNEIIRRFPHESALAFARAIGAYMNAKSGRS